MASSRFRIGPGIASPSKRREVRNAIQPSIQGFTLMNALAARSKASWQPPKDHRSRTLPARVLRASSRADDSSTARSIAPLYQSQTSLFSFGRHPQSRDRAPKSKLLDELN